MPNEPTGQYRTKRDVAHAQVRAAILSGKYRPGDRLRLQELAKSLNLSITPVREALMRLESEGLLTGAAHRGVRVADLQPVEARELYLIRLALEPLAVKFAAQAATQADLDEMVALQQAMRTLRNAGKTDEMLEVNLRLHTRIYRASGLPLLASVIEQLLDRCPRDILSVLPGRSMESVEEHEQILEALETREPARAEALMKTHLERSFNSLVKYSTGSKKKAVKGRTT